MNIKKDAYYVTGYYEDEPDHIYTDELLSLKYIDYLDDDVFELFLFTGVAYDDLLKGVIKLGDYERFIVQSFRRCEDVYDVDSVYHNGVLFIEQSNDNELSYSDLYEDGSRSTVQIYLKGAYICDLYDYYDFNKKRSYVLINDRVYYLDEMNKSDSLRIVFNRGDGPH